MENQEPTDTDTYFQDAHEPLQHLGQSVTCRCPDWMAWQKCERRTLEPMPTEDPRPAMTHLQSVSREEPRGYEHHLFLNGSIRMSAMSYCSVNNVMKSLQAEAKQIKQHAFLLICEWKCSQEISETLEEQHQSPADSVVIYFLSTYI